MEKDLKKLISEIKPADENVRRMSEKNWDSIAKPLKSLGYLEEAISKIASVKTGKEISLDKKKLYVFCADNGVVAQNVTQCSYEVTSFVAKALAEGTSTVNPMAKVAGCDVIPVDVGIRDFEGYPGVISKRIRNGTDDISKGPAMSRDECIKAIMSGAAITMESNADILAIGEMGIGNTTTSSALCSVLLNKDPLKITGRGAGLSDEGLKRKVNCIRTAIKVNGLDLFNADDILKRAIIGDAGDPDGIIDVLAKAGGLDIAAMCGAYIGAARAGIPVIIDGVVSSAAALCAVLIAPVSKDYMLASHISSEPAGKLILDALCLNPLIDAGMHLGEGSGAVAAMPLLDMALAVYKSGQDFDKLGIEAYVPQ